MAAVDVGARRVAQHLVASGVRGIDVAFDRPEVAGLYTCEGTYLPGLPVLSLAAARDNRVMVELLLPVSDEWQKKDALSTAAQLGRMATIQTLPAARGHRSAPFAKLLVAHGARLSIAAGADSVRLSEEERDKLNILLARADDEEAESKAEEGASLPEGHSIMSADGSERPIGRS